MLLSSDTYDAQVLARSGIVSYWPLNDKAGSTSVLDKKGGRHGTKNGTIIFQNVADPIGGEEKKAPTFNPSGTGWIDCGSSSALRPTEITLSCWVRLTDTGGVQIIMINRTGSGEASGATIFYNSNLCFYATSSTAGWEVNMSGPVLETNRWYHVAFTVKPTASIGYVNGVQVCSAVGLTLAYTGHGGQRIGGDDNGIFYVKGSIARAAIYNRALTAAEIKADFIAGQSEYDQLILNDNPVAYWPLDEAAGATTALEKAAGQNGTASGGVTFGETGCVLGERGTAAAFDGTGQIATSANGPSGTGAVSFELWAKFTSSDNNLHVVNIGEADTDKMVFLVLYGGGFKYGHWGSTQLSAQTYNDGNWHHVAVVYDQTAIYLYVDGVLDSQYAHTTLNLTALPVYFGEYRGGGSFYFTGSMARPAIFDYAISPHQVARHYQQGLTIKNIKALTLHHNPSLYLPLAANANDESGNSLNGTISGGVTFGSDDPVWQGPGGSAVFDGTGNVSIANNPAFRTLPLTFSLWVKTSAGNASALSNIDYYGGQHGFMCYIRPGNVAANWGTDWLEGVTPVIDGKWHHIVCTHNGTTASIYIDGVLDSQGTLTSNLSDTTALFVAQYGNYPGVRVTGSIAQVRVIPRALTASEIAQMYNNDVGLCALSTVPKLALLSGRGTSVTNGALAQWDGVTGLSATQGTGGAQPVVVRQVLNGKPVVTFDGSQLLTTSGAAFAARQVYAVVRSPQSTWSNYGSWFGNASSQSSRTFLLSAGDTGFWNDPSPSAVYRNGILLSAPFSLAPITDWMVTTVNGANNSVDHAIGSVDAAGGPGYTMKVDVAGDIAFDAVLSDSERCRQERWLARYFRVGKPPLGSIVNRRHPLSKGLVGCWLFNEGTGTVVQNLGTAGGTGTASDGVTWTNDASKGTVATFNGSSGYVDAGSSIPYLPTYSVSAWVKTTNFGDNPIVVRRNGADTASIVFDVYQGTVFAGHHQVSDGVFKNVQGVVRVDDGNWHHLSVVYDAATIRIYVDGVADGSVAATAPKDGRPTTVGFDAYNVHYTTGSISQAQFWNRALSADEVATLYNDPYCLIDYSKA